MMLCLHFVIDSGILVLIEKNAFKFITKLFTKQLPEQDTTIVYDDDVKAEHERVA